MTGVNLRLDWTGLMISGCVQILRITGSSSFVSGLGSFARQGITFLLAFHRPESPAASSFDSATPPRLTGDLRGEIFGRNVTLLCRLFRTHRYLDVHDRGREGTWMVNVARAISATSPQLSVGGDMPDT